MYAAFDLTPRQTARVLEQAQRAQAELELDLRQPQRDVELRGTLAARDDKVLRVRVEGGAGRLPVGALGAFCDARMMISEQMFLFTSCVLDVVDASDAAQLLLGIPDTVQVANRRKFERHTVPTASHVRIDNADSSGHYVALLADVCREGLACTLSSAARDEVPLVGDAVHLTFELPGEDQSYELPATVCNKLATRDGTLMTLGLQFDTRSSDPAERRAYARFCNALQDMMAETQEGNP
jgi:hypothetical protein